MSSSTLYLSDILPLWNPNLRDSAQSSIPRSPYFLGEKRRHEQKSQEAKRVPKRSRTMGRPKNAWTSTRLRKLVRLYLMTNLEVIEIANVLQEKDFRPSKRDVQKQLESLLQPRPNQIRLGAHDTKARLRVLRDLRKAREVVRTAKLSSTEQKPQNLTGNQHGNMLEETQGSDLIPTFDAAELDLTWIDRGLDSSHEAPLQYLDYFPFQKPSVLEEGLSEMSPEVTSITPLPAPYFFRVPVDEIRASNPDHLHAFNSEIPAQKVVEDSTILNQADTFDLPPGREVRSQPVREPFVDSVKFGGNEALGLPMPTSQYTSPEMLITYPPAIPVSCSAADSHSAIIELLTEGSGSNQSNSTPNYPETFRFPPDDYSICEAKPPGEWPNTDIQQPIEGHHSRASAFSVESLKRRLSSKYSPSCLEEIMSLMERHTISRTSSKSSATTSSTWSKKPSRSDPIPLEAQRTLGTLSAIDEHPVLRNKSRSLVILPGAFPKYCLAKINENSLEKCPNNPNCRHTSPDNCQLLTKQIGFKRVFYHRLTRQGSDDLFSNSTLHVAATLSAPVKFLVDLIKYGVNINSVNVAGETFLHLVYAPTEEDDVCVLLEQLSIRGFNFGQHDQHGQTGLHLLTRPWLPRQFLIKVIRKIQSLGFVLPTTRDSLGVTILGQMEVLGKEVLGFDPHAETVSRMSLGLTCETQGCIVGLQDPVLLADSIVYYSQIILDCAYSPGRYNDTATEQYLRHAELLNIITSAGVKPWFEKADGRNGIHCLAEVAFDLPMPSSHPNEDQPSRDEELNYPSALQQQYLDNLKLLLAAGVNPNNYDKQGSTPLMAFILHIRHHEDDEATTRLLTTLVEAKADISRRNRRGETALHLAVKLGRRAATKFLLRKGANVHARNKKGAGVLEVGEQACNRAIHDTTLYAQIRLCMALAMTAGAVSEPTILMEWVPPKPERI